MNGAWHLIHRLLREEKRIQKLSVPTEFNYYNDSRGDSLMVMSVASGGTCSIDLPEVDKKLTLLNIVFFRFW
jgi:hypothetical protein